MRRPSPASGAALACVLLGSLAVVVAPPPSDVGSSTLTSSPAGANRLGGSKATFDRSKGGWDGDRDTALKQVQKGGDGALRLRNKADHRTKLVARSGAGRKSWTKAKPGTRWFGRVAVRADDRRREVVTTIRFLDGDGDRLAQAKGQDVVDRRSEWRRTWRTVGIAPKRTEYVVLRVTVRGTRPGEKHFLDNARLASAPGSSRDVVGPLRTKGNKILDGNGNRLVLRGFTRSGLEGVHWSPPTADDLDHAKRWGANVIRIPLGEQFWRPTSCRHDPTYVREVDKAVNKITGRGMVAMLDLHWHAIEHCGAVGQQPMADYPNTVNFWKQVATRYKSNDLVAFDLYNEPHDISDHVWRWGGRVTWQGTTFSAAGMHHLYSAVRNDAGAKNLVIVTGNDWGNRFPTTAPIDGRNIVYAAHVYTCPTEAPPRCASSEPYNPGKYLKGWVKPGQKYPVMVTEFGWPDPQNGRYMREVIQYAEKHGWGWTAYSWGPHTWSPYALVAEAGPSATYQPTPTGQPVLGGFPGR